jgi:hypothetical protein
MSERGSFVTEYIYCDKCLEKMKLALLGDEKYLYSEQIRGLPIIGGKIGGSYSGEEAIWLEFEAFENPDTWPCHPVRIAVHSDCGGSYIFVVDKDGTVEILAHHNWQPWINEIRARERIK